MSCRAASPEAETMSYWPPPPPAMRVTISSDEPAYFAVTWQPVVFSNDSIDGELHVGSTYPSHAIRFNLPSPRPMAVGVDMPAVGGWSAVEPGGVLAEPQAVSAMTAADTTVASRNRNPDPASVLFILPSL